MSYSLVIVESPAKCQKIEKFLGPGYKVMGSYGHITHLSNLKQIEFENNYKPNFEIIESKQPQINKLKNEDISKCGHLLIDLITIRYKDDLQKIKAKNDEQKQKRKSSKMDLV